MHPFTAKTGNNTQMQKIAFKMYVARLKHCCSANTNNPTQKTYLK